MSTTTSRTRQSGRTTRPATSWLRQTLRLTRTELTLFLRYKTAWMYVVLPLILFLPALAGPSPELFEGFTTTELGLAGAIGGIGVILGIGHASNVFTARRESLVLKRLRVSGVPQSAIFGAMIMFVFVVSLAVTALVVAALFAVGQLLPADPLMLVFSVFLGVVAMSLIGLLITPLVRNAEAAQMAAMVPLLILLYLGGIIMPLEAMGDSVRQVAQLLPVVPTVEMAQAAYSGHDVFGGVEGAEAMGFVGLWVSALPSIGLMLGWIAVLSLLVRRYFRWDPRQP